MWHAGRLAGAVLIMLAPAAPLAAQTDYYNTDAGRPVRIEDAYPVERYAFEAQVAPLRLERTDAGAYHWEFEPELAYGIFPHTQVEVGLPLSFRDEGEARGRFGLVGVEVSVLHNLNVETRTLPAFAVAADMSLPVGNFAPDRVYPSVKGIATRTFGFARFHVNGQYTFGSVPEEGVDVGEASRWMVGVAVDKTFPLRSALVIADVFAEQPLHDGDDLQWTAEAGMRYQLNPFFALDAGIGRRLTGDEQGWFVTFGAARAFAVRSLMPIPGR
ncbi:MAG TPA: transporter [Chloroflexota bacterium]|nr:transporter [Chloroflexota bacterium]